MCLLCLSVGRNERFLTWVKSCEKQLAASQSSAEPQPRIEFDIPYRELKFTGVPAKSSVDIMPTVHRSLSAHPSIVALPMPTSYLCCVLTVLLLLLWLHSLPVGGAFLCVCRLCLAWWRWTTSRRWCCR